jgi:ABC-type nitrate/sulfonate/bicarbonate transport system substrate-binding protein
MAHALEQTLGDGRTTDAGAHRLAGLGQRVLALLSVVAAVLVAALVPVARAQSTQNNSFSAVVGNVPVGEVQQGTVQVPFITWGGDVATFVANGGLKTAPGSTFAKLGIDMQLVNGDDFAQQVRNYLKGTSPFLRGELRMLALASEVVGNDPRTKPVVFLQLTWSAGDHLVGRPTIATLNDLRGKRIALQRNGPHVGMLDDILRSVRLAWSDITVVWCDKLTGEGGPADAFRKDPTIDAAFVISPDMLGLTGGLESTGTGAEGTVENARVVVSTAQMSRAIADVYAVRKDWFDKNRAWVEKFVAGYFSGSERVVEKRNAFAQSGTRDTEYFAMLQQAQDILGKEVLPTLDVDAHGLLLDASFVGLPGNKGFFTDKGNLDGFDAKTKAALDLAVGQGYAKIRAGFLTANLDYDNIAKLGGLRFVTAQGGERFTAEAIDAFPSDALDDKTLLSFTIAFEPNQETFDPAVYGPEFLRAVQSASTFGSAVVAVRGHADPTKVLVDFVRAGLEKKVLTRTGTQGNFKYFYKGKELSLASADELQAIINSGALDGAATNPRDTLQAALNLSRARAEAVRDAIVLFAKDQGLRLDKSQIQPVGVGVAEPVVPTPRNAQDAKQNMRVEFRLVRVPAESVKPGDFDY